MTFINLVLGTFLILVLHNTSSHHESPCPKTFVHKHGNGNDSYGLITIRPKGPVNLIIVKANFTIEAHLPTSYQGILEPLDPADLERKMTTGEPITYRVNYPLTSPLPYPTSIVANGQKLCSAPQGIPSPILTAITLEHVLKLSSIPGLWADISDPDGNNNFQDAFTSVSNIGTTLQPNAGSNSIINHNNQSPPVNTYKPQPPVHAQQLNLDNNTPSAIPMYPGIEINPVEHAESNAAVECGIPSSAINPLVFGDEYLRGEWPWVVALFKIKAHQMRFECSGTLVSEWHVITAAHCMHIHDMVTYTHEVLIKLGAYDLDDFADDITKNSYISKATIHDAYDPYTLKNDILILTLKKKVIYNNYIRPICLWSGDQTDISYIVNKRGVVAGWGENESKEPGQGKPRHATLSIVSTETCRASRPEFYKLTSDTTLCAGDRNGTGPCNGDSGGGLYVRTTGDNRWKLRGITSASLRSDYGEYVQAQSPCPGIFDYENKGSETYGVVTIQPTRFSPVSFLNVKVNLTIPTRLPSSYHGKLEPIIPIDFKEKLKTGERITYRVDFPVSSPLPRPTSVEANGNILCFSQDSEDNNLDPFTYTSLSLAPYSYISQPFTSSNSRDPSPLGIDTIHQDIDAGGPVQNGAANPLVECGISSDHFPFWSEEENTRRRWPWLVAIFEIKTKAPDFICSGSLISNKHVIAAAHCMKSYVRILQKNEAVARLGAYDLTNLADNIAKTYYIDDVTFHGGYDIKTLKNNLLILKLRETVVFSVYVKPVCLWEEYRTDINLIVNKRGLVAGWGFGKNRPHEITVPIVSTPTCRASRNEFHPFTSDMTLCVGDRNGTGPCPGDSGLYMKESNDKHWKLRGIASVSLENDDDEEDRCNRKDYVVFTDVAKYITWIKSVISKY
ncbi:hypothetical protein K1T71_011386 [Dendrolimus kikuchii]|uniref:Uncharacterized protein n=1 Tax=Dendrolimus kikuchii TaxID=765133 RepID=A0ACC1CNM5_9NEOP|nr:hypothetical protein K1T71_011386 [Dendrolimus kikuchii]